MTRDAGLAKVEAIYLGQDAEGRRIMLAHAMALRDVTGRSAAPRVDAPTPPG
jgi:hypothetical protein